MKQRAWHYIENPAVYQITCDLCSGTNIQWSEYEGYIWCFDCQKDTKGTGGIFDGPIPLELCRMLGISFDRFDLEIGRVLKIEAPKNGRIVWE